MADDHSLCSQGVEKKYFLLQEMAHQNVKEDQEDTPNLNEIIEIGSFDPKKTVRP
jgi:hypothetical protein